MFIKILSVLLLGVISDLHAQYLPKSQFINQPELAIAFVKGVADFHATAKDTTGGYFTFINADGTIKATQKLDWLDYEMKSFCAVSRSAYTFVRAFMLTGELKYLEEAQHALDYLYKYGWDETNGGWYFTRDVTNNKSFGAPWKPNEKWTFQQQYAMVGITAMLEATGGKSTQSVHRDWFEKSTHSLSQNLWDSSTDRLGYFEFASEDWQNKRGKGFTATIDGINTHAAISAQIFNNDTINLRYQQLADIALERLVGNMDEDAVKMGFPEIFSSNWTIDPGQKDVSIGHLIKTAWCLGRASIFFDDDRYRNGLEKILDQIMHKSSSHDPMFDHTYGGAFEAGDWSSGRVTSKNKNHWVMEQGLTAGLVGYFLSKDEQKRATYLMLADESLKFFEDYSLDKNLGVSHMLVKSNGAISPDQTNLPKADLFKAGFHDAELGYYTYLYGQSYYHVKPFKLFYFFNKVDDDGKQHSDRIITLTPITMPEGTLSIQSVKLDGIAFNDFEKQSRTLNIAAGVGGIFEVIFEPQTKRDVVLASESDPAKSPTPEITVFPNPFTDFFNISNLDKSIETKNIWLYDISGQLIACDIFKNKKIFQVIPKVKLKDGIYVLQIKMGQNLQSVRLIKKHDGTSQPLMQVGRGRSYF